MIQQNVKDHVITRGKKIIDAYNSGHLEMEMGYKFRTKEFLDILFLYTNSVDVRNPDILGASNRNTFIYEAQSEIMKIKEQTRLDVKDINFSVPSASSLARYIPRAANRKMLEENEIAVEIDQFQDNAVDFGSGFIKTWEVNGKMKIKNIDPFFIIFDQYNFRNGPKIERMRKTWRWAIENDKYDEAQRDQLKLAIPEDKLDDTTVFYQMVEDREDDKSQEISVFNLDQDIVLYHFKNTKRIVKYYKHDYIKRVGFPDALGKGANELIFNQLVQSKVNRDRMDKIMQIASALPFQKQLDGERDEWAGQQVLNIETGTIIGHRGNPVTPMDTGGIKQANLIVGQLNELTGRIGKDLNVGDALAGNTLPSGTSAALGNLLTENASSVLKEYKKNLAKTIDFIYRDGLNEWILKVFSSEDALEKYLDPTDIKQIEINVIDYLVVQYQIDAAINGEDMPYSLAVQKAKRAIKGKPIISGDLLKELRNEVKGIRTYITGESVSKAQTVAFLREMRQTYAANPALFKSPFYIETLKKEAEFDAGISSLEIDNLLRELRDEDMMNPQQQMQQEQVTDVAQMV